MVERRIGDFPAHHGRCNVVGVASLDGGLARLWVAHCGEFPNWHVGRFLFWYAGSWLATVAIDRVVIREKFGAA